MARTRATLAEALGAGATDGLGAGATTPGGAVGTRVMAVQPTCAAGTKGVAPVRRKPRVRGGSKRSLRTIMGAAAAQSRTAERRRAQSPHREQAMHRLRRPPARPAPA